MFSIVQHINQSILVFMNNLAQFTVVKDMAIVSADAPIFFLPMFLLGWWIYHNHQKENILKTDLLVIFYGILIALICSIGIQHIVYMERPLTFLWVHAKFILNHIPDASFPSDHATVSAAFLTGILLAGYRKTFWIYLPFVVIMLLSRVIAWVHWPLDIVAWTILGSVMAVIISKTKTTKIVVSLNNFILKIASFIRL